MNFENFIQKLRARLAQPLPGEEAQFKMAPARRLTLKKYYELRNGDPMYSAVLVCLFPMKQSIFTVLMLRPPSELGAHSNQVSFPGGRFEESDVTLENTALREANEEIGMNQAEVQLLGRLSPLYIPVSNYLVQPIVGFVSQQPEFILNDLEVTRVLETDCKYFLDEGIKGESTFKSGIGDIEAPFYKIHELKVWGATAMILSEFESILREIYFPDKFVHPFIFMF
jgi:8-oxo-dGTP pyrophosphatase MutT (NUDIX family)